jgi:predicted  nucleic acid-binding Zn-ribbon protein
VRWELNQTADNEERCNQARAHVEKLYGKTLASRDKWKRKAIKMGDQLSHADLLATNLEDRAAFVEGKLASTRKALEEVRAERDEAEAELTHKVKGHSMDCHCRRCKIVDRIEARKTKEFLSGQKPTEAGE